MKKENDLFLLKEYLSNINKKNVEKKSLGNYENAVLVCLDAVLSINRKYYTFVVPRIIHFQNKYSGVTRLEELINLIDDVGIDGFSECWNYNHTVRVKMLHNLCERLIEISNLYKAENELLSLRKWASQVSINAYDCFNVAGIGFTTFQYIRMLLGANTVKPDVHIKNEISKIIGRKINDKYAVELFENACNDLELSTSDIEHYIWKKCANNSENFNMIWENNNWKVRKNKYDEI